jgi:hypothetical protein
MFKSFVKNYSVAYYDVHVYIPEGEEMDPAIAYYTKMGFPGCVGSMDVTHLMWKQCPSAALRHVCTGRYHCPSVVFQMVCAGFITFRNLFTAQLTILVLLTMILTHEK